MIRSIAVSLVCLVLTACGGPAGAPVVVRDVVITSPAAGMPMAAGYFELENRSGELLRITSVSSPEYESVEMHETVVTDGISRMREIPGLEVGAGETVLFERGGKHLMLMRPTGDTKAVTLNFYSNDILVVSVNAEFAATTQ